MTYGDDILKIKADLAKLGPRAVEVLARRLEGKQEQVSGDQMAAAQELLDRLDIRRSGGPA